MYMCILFTLYAVFIQLCLRFRAARGVHICVVSCVWFVAMAVCIDNAHKFVCAARHIAS